MSLLKVNPIIMISSNKYSRKRRDGMEVLYFTKAICKRRIANQTKERSPNSFQRMLPRMVPYMHSWIPSIASKNWLIRLYKERLPEYANLRFSIVLLRSTIWIIRKTLVFIFPTARGWKKRTISYGYLILHIYIEFVLWQCKLVSLKAINIYTHQ